MSTPCHRGIPVRRLRGEEADHGRGDLFVVYVHGVMKGGPARIGLRVESGADTEVLEQARDEFDLLVLDLDYQRRALRVVPRGGAGHNLRRL